MLECAPEQDNRRTRLAMNDAARTADSPPPAFRLAHSLLLSRFRSPSAPRWEMTTAESSAWTTALSETPNSAINRFIQANLLVPFSPSTPETLTQGLASIYGVVQLKAMLKLRQLKVSGKKDELIARLVHSHSQGLMRDVLALGLYHCSDAGMNFVFQLEERKQRAYANAVAAIHAKDYSAAIREYQALEDDLAFPKFEFEGTPRPALIQFVMTVTPTILDGCSQEVLSRLRIAIALQCVGGRHAPREVLRGFNTGIRLDAETAARMIYFSARHTEDMQQWKQMRVIQVAHLATPGSCSVCMGFNGHKWNIDQAPELPYPHCTSETGCRCLYLPVRNT
jgi:SAP domain